MSQLARISWLVTVGICLITRSILLLSGYDGYAGVDARGRDRGRRINSVREAALARPHAVLGLEVDQHVGAVELGLDRVLQLVRRCGAPPRATCRGGTARAGRRSGARPPGGCAAGGSRRRRGRRTTRSRRGSLVAARRPAAPRRQHAQRAHRDPDAGDDDRRRDHAARRRASQSRAGHADQREADEHADRRVGVGAQVRRVALQRRARRLARARNSQLETARLATLAKPMTTMPMPRFSSSGRGSARGSRRRRSPPSRRGSACPRRPRRRSRTSRGRSGGCVGRLLGAADGEERDQLASRSMPSAAPR